MSVPAEVLEALYQEFAIWEKVDDGRALLEVRPATTRPSRDYLGALSEIVLVFILGNQVGTFHRIIDPSTGQVHHRDASNFYLEGLCLFREKPAQPHVSNWR